MPETRARLQENHPSQPNSTSLHRSGTPTTVHIKRTCTFASHWVLTGGSIEKLSTILGHASVTTTERYAQLGLDLFRESDYALVDVDLGRPRGQVVALSEPTETEQSANQSLPFGYSVG